VSGKGGRKKGKTEGVWVPKGSPAMAGHSCGCNSMCLACSTLNPEPAGPLKYAVQYTQVLAVSANNTVTKGVKHP
jgi:hypothetical protein